MEFYMPWNVRPSPLTEEFFETSSLEACFRNCVVSSSNCFSKFFRDESFLFPSASGSN